MRAMRAVKVITVFAVLLFIGNVLLFHSVATRGYGHTIDALHPTFGSADSLVLALFSVVRLVSIPAMALFGVIGILAAKQFGRPALLLGFLCCVLSASSFVLWKKYGGMPGTRPGTNGPTPVTRRATPVPSPRRSPQ